MRMCGGGRGRKKRVAEKGAKEEVRVKKQMQLQLQSSHTAEALIVDRT